MNLRRAVLEVQSCLIDAGYATELSVGDVYLGNSHLESIRLTVFYQALRERKAYTVELMAANPSLSQRLQIGILTEMKVHFISLEKPMLKPTPSMVGLLYLYQLNDDKFNTPVQVACEIISEVQQAAAKQSQKDTATSLKQSLRLKADISTSAYKKGLPPKPKGVSKSWDARRYS